MFQFENVGKVNRIKKWVGAPTKQVLRTDFFISPMGVGKGLLIKWVSIES